MIRFVDNMELESTVLYPTAGLAIGLVQNPEWACSVAKGVPVSQLVDFVSLQQVLK